MNFLNLNRKQILMVAVFFSLLIFTSRDASAALTLGSTTLSSDGTLTLTTPTSIFTLPTSKGVPGQVLQTDGSGITSWITLAEATNGTVTSVSVVDANGISGIVTNPTTTPAITLTLGAITPGSVAALGTVTGSNLSGTNTGDQIISDSTITFSDITTGNFSTTEHGFVPKGTNVGNFLRDDGTFAPLPSGSQWTNNGSDIFFNTGNVGIGTDTPESVLHIHGSLAAGWSSGLEITREGGGDTRINATPSGTLFRNMGAGMTFGFRNSNNAEAVTITEDGKLGINTPELPSSRLTIYGTVADSWESGLEIIRGDGGVLLINSSAGGALFRTNTSGMAYYFRNAADATIFTILENGKVGIGLTVPTAVLNLKAGTASADTAPLKFTAGTLLGTTEAGAIEYDGTHLYFTAANAGTRFQLDQQGGGGGAAAANTLTGNTLASNVLASSLTSVGTLANLTVTAPINGSITGNAGTATTSNNLTGGAAGSIPYQSASGTTAFLANGTAGQVLQSNGTTLAPSWVSAGGGSSGANTSLSNLSAVSITTDLIGATPTQFINPIGWGIRGGPGPNDDLILEGTTSATKTSSFVLLQPNGGNVGIGAGSPAALLHLFKNTDSATSIRIENPNPGPNTGMYLATTDGNRSTFFGQESTGTFTSRNNRGYVYNDGAGLNFYAVGSGGNMKFYTSNGGSVSTENLDMTLTNSGRLGLGTTAPNTKFEVFGENPADRNTIGTQSIVQIVRERNMEFGNQWPQVVAFQVGSHAGSSSAVTRFDINLKAVADISYTADTNVMSLLSNGNVGIGATAPAQKLEVNGTIRQTGGVNCALSANASGDIICLSDINLKQNSRPFTLGLSAIMGINPEYFQYKGETYTHAGFIAQNVQTVIPEATPLQGNGFLGLDSNAILAASVNAIKELNIKIDNLELTGILSDPSSSLSSLSNSFFDDLFARLSAWLGTAANGITRLFAREINTEILCVSDSTGARTCIDKNALDELIANAARNNSEPSGSDASVSPEPTPEPAVDSSTETAPEPTTDTPPESAPDAVAPAAPETDTSLSTPPTVPDTEITIPPEVTDTPPSDALFDVISAPSGTSPTSSAFNSSVFFVLLSKILIVILIVYLVFRIRKGMKHK